MPQARRRTPALRETGSPLLDGGAMSSRFTDGLKDGIAGDWVAAACASVILGIQVRVVIVARIDARAEREFVLMCDWIMRHRRLWRCTEHALAPRRSLLDRKLRTASRPMRLEAWPGLA